MQRILLTGLLAAGLVAAARPISAQTLTERLQAEGARSLAAAAREQGSAVRGAILFTQRNLSCTRCHIAGDQRMLGPDLTRLGDDVTDLHLVESLLEPSRVIRKGFESVIVVTTSGLTVPGRIVQEHPERLVVRVAADDQQLITIARSEIEQIAPNKLSAMPANLLDQLRDRGQFLDLARYVMQLASTGSSAPSTAGSGGGQTVRDELQGAAWIREFHCAACHQDDLAPARLRNKQAPVLAESAAHIVPHHIQQFLASPLTVRPGTTMPDVMSHLSSAEREVAARELTHFLVSNAAPATPPESDDTPDAESHQRGRELFHTIGCVACHSPRDSSGRESLAESSVPLGTIPRTYHFPGLVEFLKDPLKTRPGGRMPRMNLTHWEAVDLASYLQESISQPTDPVDREFKLDKSLADSGRRRFEALGCRQCHANDSGRPVSRPLSALRPEHGCLSTETGSWPRFDLSPTQRTQIQAALAHGRQEWSDRDQLELTLTGLRCLNCHQRNELGGVPLDRDPHFSTTNQNLGPQGRIPPVLTGVGAKLKPKWMRQVLVSGRAIRPYVLTRMPQFGTENIEHVVELFAQQDRLPPVEFAEFDDQKKMRETGHQLAGTTGLNCIVCHTFQLQKAANMPAVDLTEMTERLRQDWFYHYMRSPQQMSPNTIMPSFFPAGRSMRTDILDGHADLQIEALWQYLLDGRQARPPQGLIREPLELLATDEAVMLRRSYEGIGKRGIGVGYPQQVNLAFDAEQMRLAMIWKGKFAEAGGVWRSQGHGRVHPLGGDLIRFAAGPDIDDAEAPWVPDEGRPPRHRFRGYELDAKRRPRFLYDFAGSRIEDYPVDLLDAKTGRPFLRRVIRITPGPQADAVSFRAATGSRISRDSEDRFVVDGKLQVTLTPAVHSEIVTVAETRQLRLRIELDQQPFELTVDYRW